MPAVVASLKRISLESVFFRHPIDEKRLAAIMSYILGHKKWDLPPPLVVEQTANGLRYFWVLDGHHRITAAKLFEQAIRRAPQIWAFVVAEADYRTLIQSQFGGIEPTSIPQVREHIATPFGDANLSDRTWAVFGDTLKRRASASFPVFVFEKNRRSVSNIGFFTAGFTLDGAIWIKDRRSQRTVIQMPNPPTQQRVRQDQSIRLKGNDGEDFEIDISANWDFGAKCAEFEVRSPGIRLCDSLQGGEVPEAAVAKTISVTREKLFSHSRVIMSAIRRVNREFEGIVVDGVNADDADAPWFLLNEFDFTQPATGSAPEPSGFTRARRASNQARHRGS